MASSAASTGSSPSSGTECAKETDEERQWREAEPELSCSEKNPVIREIYYLHVQTETTVDFLGVSDGNKKTGKADKVQRKVIDTIKQDVRHFKLFDEARPKIDWDHADQKRTENAKKMFVNPEWKGTFV